MRGLKAPPRRIVPPADATARAQLCRLVGDRDRVQVDDAVDGLAAVLAFHVLDDRADVVAQVLAAGGLDSREDAHHQGL